MEGYVSFDLSLTPIIFLGAAVDRDCFGGAPALLRCDIPGHSQKMSSPLSVCVPGQHVVTPRRHVRRRQCWMLWPESIFPAGCDRRCLCIPRHQVVIAGGLDVIAAVSL